MDKNIRDDMVNEVMSPNPLSEGNNVYPYISFEGKVFVLDKDKFEQWPDSPIYHKLPEYDTYPKAPLFSRQMSVAEMAQEFPVNNVATVPSGSSEDVVDAPIAHNEGNEDPATQSAMYSAFDSMDDSFNFPDPSDAATAEEAPSKSEHYQSEGESELRDPFCVV